MLNQGHGTSIFEIIEIPRAELDSKRKEKIFYAEIIINEIPDTFFEGIGTLRSPINFIKYSPISEFPSSTRDFSFSISKSHSVNEVISYFDSLSQENLKKVFLFDFYKNEKTNEVKLGYRLVFQSFTKTLSDNEIRDHVLKILKPVLRKEGVEIQGFESLL